jgi:hypothetical protein
MIINTQLDIAHIELIKIFIKANDLVGIVLREYPIEVRGRFHMCLQLESTFEDTSIALTFMGVIHCGVLNMLDDYLMKCGVTPDSLKPKSIHRQLQEEREAKFNEEFMTHLLEIKEQHEHSNK